MLDKARGSSIVWISAPAGSGKTTLVADYIRARKLRAIWYQMDVGDNDPASFFYFMGLTARELTTRVKKSLPLLTREYLGGLQAFTVNYFRDLFSRIKRTQVLVFDNYQELLADNVMQEMLREGFGEIPAGLTIIVLSRENPPSHFARLHATKRISLLGWEDLQLTEVESTAIAALRRKHAPLMPEEMRALYRRTHGWVAGLVLLTESDGSAVKPSAEESRVGKFVFEYFAHEVFVQADSNMKKFLLETAFLPNLSVRLAEELTGERNASSILKMLRRRNFFTVERSDGTYEYHPLFRDFLAARLAATYSPEQIRTLQQRTADLLALSGDAETAVLLLQSAEYWPQALRLILDQAPSLVSQGRTKTLEKWLEALPAARRTTDSWVIYWFGVCQLSFSPAKARTYFETAFSLFEKEADASPLYLAWNGIIESFVLERDDFTPMKKWLDVYPSLDTQRIPPNADIRAMSVFTYISGLRNASFEHPDLPRYAAHAVELLKHEAISTRRFTQVVTLIPYYLWKGDLVEVSHLLESLSSLVQSPDAGPLAYIFWCMWKCLHAASAGSAEESLAVMNDGLVAADRSGIHIFDLALLGYCIWGQLCAGNVKTARELLDRMPERLEHGQINQAFYRHFLSLVLLHEGSLSRAVEEGERAAKLAKACGMSLGSVSYHIGWAFALAYNGQLDAALEIVSQARADALAMNSRLFTANVALCEANIYRIRGDQVTALRMLNEALTLANEISVVTPGYCPRDEAALLYAMALDAGIHVDYVRSTIAKTHLPPPPEVLSERWPWPIRVYTFGRFLVVKDNVPLVFSGKAQKKPLELLRALVALGGRDVNTSKIAKLLWPGAGADMGRQNLKITLHRLREMIGEECILRQENQLTLNPRSTWFDVRAFEQLVVAIGKLPSATLGMQRLFGLYAGPFLEEDDSVFAHTERERFHKMFVRTVVQLGAALEAQEGSQAAIPCYEKGVEIDPLIEEFYRRLMQCYRRLNRSAEALAVYQRCKTMLSSALHVEPSEETRLLYRTIQSEASVIK